MKKLVMKLRLVQVVSLQHNQTRCPLTLLFASLAERHVANELATRAIATKVIKTGDCVLDLGANVGFHTRAFSDLVGPDGVVHAFEPNPDLWQHFQALTNVRLWPFAVGRSLSLETFYLPLQESQVGSLVDARDFLGDVPTKILTVVQVPVDELEEATRRPISFIKIDVERYEEHALNGLVKTINRYRPIIVFENNTPAIEDLLNSIGYDVYEMIDAKDAPKLANVAALPHECDKSGVLLSGGDIDSLLRAVKEHP